MIKLYGVFCMTIVSLLWVGCSSPNNQTPTTTLPTILITNNQGAQSFTGLSTVPNANDHAFGGFTYTFNSSGLMLNFGATSASVNSGTWGTALPLGGKVLSKPGTYTITFTIADQGATSTDAAVHFNIGDGSANHDTGPIPIGATSAAITGVQTDPSGVFSSGGTRNGLFLEAPVTSGVSTTTARSILISGITYTYTGSAVGPAP